MKPLLVKAILGDPYDPDSADDLWCYDDGTINFNEDSKRVEQYDFNLGKVGSRADLSQWDKIRKDLTTKSQVISYLGNPNSASIECESVGELEETWTYFSETHHGSLYFDENGRLYKLSLKTHEEVKKDGDKVTRELKLDNGSE